MVCFPSNRRITARENKITGDYLNLNIVQLYPEILSGIRIGVSDDLVAERNKKLVHAVKLWRCVGVLKKC